MNERESLAGRWQSLVENLDKLTDPEHRSDLFETHQWDRLMELHSFASRVIVPTDLIVTSIERLKGTILEDPNSYKKGKKLQKILDDIEKESQLNFRPRNKSDIS